jgi:hypothetical protein
MWEPLRAAIFRLANSAGRRSRLRAGLRVFTHMGDKSPKTKNKQAAQKQAKADTAARQKNENKAARQVVKPKR